MKFKIKKGSTHSEVFNLLDKMNSKLGNIIDKGFYDKKNKHYVDNLREDYIIEVKIKK